MEGEGPIYTAHSAQPIVQFNYSTFSRRPTRNTCCTREGPVRKSASVLLNRVNSIKNKTLLTLIKKKIKFSSKVRKFRVEQLQSLK